MKRIAAAILFCLCSQYSFAQGSYGFGMGIGSCTAPKARITPAFEGYHLWKLSARWYAGIHTSLERYSFLYEINPAFPNYGDAINIRQKSSFLYLTPRLDFGLGYRRHLHISLLAGPGVVMSAGQTTNTYEPLLRTPTANIGADTVGFRTSYNVPRIVYKAGVHITERISTHGYFNIALTQQVHYLFSELAKNVPSVSPIYFCFTVGLVHKYPQVWREDY